MLALSASAADAGEVAYGAAYDTLYSVDIASHTAAEIGTAGNYGGVPIVNISGLSFSPDNVLYAVAGGRGDNGFYRIDTETGAATEIGSFGDDRWINTVSMGYDDAGVLWAAINYVPPAPGDDSIADWPDLARIDEATGKITFVGTITGPDSLRQIPMKGFAIGPPRCTLGSLPAAAAPVGTPPWLFALAGLLVVAAGAAIRRRSVR
jgi:hypothetical protein